MPYNEKDFKESNINYLNKDFGQFKNSKIFNTTSTPMANMINKAKAIIRNSTKRGSKVIFVTARADMDDRKLFIDTFKAQGIDMSKVYVERAGNLGTKTGKIKSIIFKKYLDSGEYKRIRLFDDSMENYDVKQGFISN